MNHINLENWPILAISVGMLAAAIIDWWKFKVPNWLTYPLILAGWVLGLANDLGLHAGDGGFGAAVAGTFLGLGLLLPIYIIGGMGAGDVKMTMGFGSWLGAFFGLYNGAGVLWYAFVVGVVVGGFIGAGMMLARRQFGQNLQHLQEIAKDFNESASITEIHSRAQGRKSRWHMLPYGVPLCIGFLSYLAYLDTTGQWPTPVQPDHTTASSQSASTVNP